ncbi:DUF4179 domain-containing protein [Brevibacillus fortis]|nr:DUF4179 domain-containing protein [Brevibacillus fortis]
MVDHIERCSYCQRQLSHYLGEIENPDNWEIVGPSTQRLVQQVINRVAPYPIHVMQRSKTNIQQKPNRWITRSITIMKKTAIAVAGIAAITYFGTLTSPTFATYVSSLVSSKPQQQQQVGSLFQKYADSEYLYRGVKQGYIQKVDLQAKDKGIIVDVKEIMTDTKDIRIILGITDTQGKQIENMFKFFPTNQDLARQVYEIKITDHEGNVYQGYDMEGYNDLHWLGDNGSLVMLNEPLTTYFTDTSEIPDKLNVQLTIKQIDKEKGNWTVNIPVDISKAKKETTIIPINKQYQSPRGTVYDLKQVMVTPGQTEIVLETTRSAGDTEELAFEIVDDKDAVLAAWSELILDQEDEDAQIPTMHNILHEQFLQTGNKKGIYFITFKNLPTDKDLTFKLSKTYTYEPVKAEMKINIEELKNKPMTSVQNGNSLTFSNFTVQELIDGSRGKELYASLDLDVTLAPNVMDLRGWAATDEQSNGYRLISFSGNRTRDENGTIKMSGKLHFKLARPPKELNIVYKSQVKERKNVDWKIAIPLKQ